MIDPFEHADTEGTVHIRAVPRLRPDEGAAVVVHALVTEGEDGSPRRVVVEAGGLTLGRAAPSEVMLAGAAVSRQHCRLELVGGVVRVVDLGSTNGTFVDGARVAAPVVLADGARLQVGPHVLRYERRRRGEAAAAVSLAEDFAKARGYVNALLPAPIAAGPVRAAWAFHPCAALGGDAFGYLADGAEWFIAYILDVSGHGVGAAMHSVSVMNVLRQRALPGVDMRAPEAVLGALNAMFDMEAHHGLYFTMWYGALHVPSGRLDYSVAGHHAAVLQGPGGAGVAALGGRAAAVGMMPGYRFARASTVVAPGSRLFLFSDGAVELAGVEWGMREVVETLCDAGSGDGGLEAPGRLYRRVRSLSGEAALEDDFSALALAIG